MGGSSSTCPGRCRTRGTEWVSAPTEMKSTPDSAYAPTVSSVTPPDTSTCDRALEQRDGLAHLLGRHVVEQHAVGAGVARLGDLVERVALDLDRCRPGQRDRARSTDFAMPSRGEVVVLDQHRVGERVAVVEAAAGAHRGLLHRPQAREASCACRGSGPGRRAAMHVAARQRRDARAVAQEVQRGALAGEDRAQRAATPGRARVPASIESPSCELPLARRRRRRAGGTSRSRARFRRARRRRARRTRPRRSGPRRRTRAT